jgi:GTP cyclohydrolase II
MSDQPADNEMTKMAAAALVHVERAIGEARRGLPVVIVESGVIAEKNARALLVLAAELASDARIEQFRAYSSITPALALTAKRAGVIHVATMSPQGTLLELAPAMKADTLRALADPAQDLDHPMMGPFRLSEMTMGASAAAAIQLCKHSELLPAALITTLEGVNPQQFAAEHDLLTVTAAEIQDYGRNTAAGLMQVVAARVPLEGAENSRLIAFRPQGGSVEHLAIVIGEPSRHAPVLTRIHSECFTGDLLGSMKCDCGQQLRGAIVEIAKAGGGVVLYLAQEGRGIGLINKLRAYRLQDQGFDTVEANERLGFDADERLFQPAAEMLKRLGFSEVRLLTNNPDKVAGLETCGIRVTERVGHKFPSNSHNEFYLATKKKRSGHYL